MMYGMIWNSLPGADSCVANVIITAPLEGQHL